MRCPVCGYPNEEGRMQCALCGTVLNAGPLFGADHPARVAASDRVPLWRGRPPALSGTVIAVEPPQLEPLDRTPSRLIRPLGLAGLLVGAAFALLANPLLLLLLAAALLIFVKLLGSTFFPFLFFPFLRPSPEKQEPVQHFRVREASGRECIVRCKGFLTAGHVMPGDELAVWGKWRHGVLNMQRALSLRTGATLFPRPRSLGAFLLGQALSGLFSLPRALARAVRGDLRP